MSSRSSKITGCILLAAAFIGFLTVADELHHTGEFFAVMGILMSGVAFLVAGQYPGTSSMLALEWVPVGIAAGALGGAVVDGVMVGVFLGTVFGLLLARLRRSQAA